MKRALSCLLIFSELSLCIAGAVSALAQEPSANKMLKRMDADGDGRIVRDEWLGPPPGFDRFDLDKSGALTRQEIDTVLSRREKPAAAKPGQTTAKIDWIDVHVHPNGGKRNRDFRSAVGGAVDAIKESSMVRAVLMPTPQSGGATWVMEDFMNEGNRHPSLFAYLGGGGTLNPMIHTESPDGTVSSELKQRFRSRAEEILARGAAGFGEMSALHVALVPGHPFESVQPDHPLLLLLADIAAENDAVIDLHHDPVAEDMQTPKWLAQLANPPMLSKNIDGLERLLAHNRKAKIIWAHAGSDNVGHWTVKLSRRLLEAHSNLYMSLRMAPGRGDAQAKTHHPVGSGFVKPGWTKLLQDFPDRFVLGGDQFFTSAFVSGPAATFGKHAKKIRNNAFAFLTYLQPDLARKIGYENAARLYKFDK